ncbi:MAG: hypothetical protein IT328_21345 [Caldilineaceae bacterium]|nr:hypothetical protein [Caldilineaceae bacterium]
MDNASVTRASMILIGHDMGLTAQVLDRVGVVYAGKLVEVASIDELYRRPKHPYTQALIFSLPSLREKKHGAIPGLPPFLLNAPPGCPRAMARCAAIPPPVPSAKTNLQRAISMRMHINRSRQADSRCHILMKVPK